VELCAMLAEYLEAEDFEVDAVHDGETGAQRAVEGGYDVVVLDVMLPRLSGLDALRRIRQEASVPVLMLTAKGDDVDRIVGLELGADDYLPKPCNPRELVARLRAILRRAGNSDEGEHHAHRELKIGKAVLYPGKRVAEWDGQALELTSTEFNVLSVMMHKAGEVVSKQELSERALGRSLARYDRSLDMHVSNLRRKLGLLDDGRSPIQTVRGVGYQYIEV
jgi:two-component system OmpR family response regulator